MLQSFTATTMATNQEAVTAEWNNQAKDWDNEGYGPREYSAAVFPLMCDAIKLDQSAAADLKVLDFGCGSGLLTEKLQPMFGQVVCVDVAEKMVDHVLAKKAKHGWANVTAVCAAVSEEFLDKHRESDPETFRAGSFDFIMCSSVLTFIPALQRTLRALASLLKPRTGLLVHSDWLPEPAATTAEEEGAEGEEGGERTEGEGGGEAAGDEQETESGSATGVAAAATSAEGGATPQQQQQQAAAPEGSDEVAGGASGSGADGDSTAAPNDVAAPATATDVATEVEANADAPLGAFDEQVATAVYDRGGLAPVSLERPSMTMMGRTSPFFLGVARAKPPPQ